MNVKRNGVNLGFLAVDATLEPGPRRPFNFVGALNQNQLVHLSGLANKGLVTNNMIDPIMSLIDLSLTVSLTCLPATLLNTLAIHSHQYINIGDEERQQ